ncbi:MAG: RNA polymerase sigma factor [uncultured Thiotrichaceae bacterium]|uniref:RNA polymerase sigma factor n=1 Tax=uncultured Thiotrichaceae bacterium TaxID=298394 RepID=A0A6S6SJB8_9GAMM|nr:MAG: RNA polymerase sigma factor [uncultured Thiotrichaceae bacterium]
MTTLTTPDKQALGDAYQALHSSLLGWLIAKVNDRSVAEDLLHDVFRKALMASDQKAPPANINAWLFTITRNTVIDYYRSKRPMLELPEELQFNDEQNNVHQQLSVCLLPMVERLPAIYRDVLIAVVFEGHTQQVAADEEGVSLSAIKSRVSRGRQLLRKSLVACCDIETSGSGDVEDFYQKFPSCDC